MAKVDPFVIRWPKQWVTDPDIAPVIKYLNRFLHDLWIRTGGGDDLIESGVQSTRGTTARLIDLEQRLGSDDPFTWDETGFSFDSTRITFDRTETG